VGATIVIPDLPNQHDPEFDNKMGQLIDSLARKHFSAAANFNNPKLADIMRMAMQAFVSLAIAQYHSTEFMDEKAYPSDLHEIARPLARVIELLSHKGNYAAVFVALGAPSNFPVKPNTRELVVAGEAYEGLLHNLKSIAGAVPPPPPVRSKGRRPNQRNLYAAVRVLVECWEAMTKKPFKQDWHKAQPTTAAAAFVFDVVTLIDAARLGELPKVTARIVNERRAAASLN
jgi:hypothetical protein